MCLPAGWEVAGSQFPSNSPCRIEDTNKAGGPALQTGHGTVHRSRLTLKQEQRRTPLSPYPSAPNDYACSFACRWRSQFNKGNTAEHFQLPANAHIPSVPCPIVTALFLLPPRVSESDFKNAHENSLAGHVGGEGDLCQVQRRAPSTYEPCMSISLPSTALQSRG